MRKNMRRHISFSSTCFCHYRKHTNNDSKIYPPASSAFSQQHFHDLYLNGTSTKFVIRQIDVNCCLVQSLNMLPFHIRPERLKMTCYNFIANFSRCYFKTGKLCLLFLFHMYLIEIILVSYFEN